MVGAKGCRNGEGPRGSGARPGPGHQWGLHRCTEPSIGVGRNPDERQSGLWLTALPSAPTFGRWLNMKP